MRISEINIDSDIDQFLKLSEIEEISNKIGEQITKLTENVQIPLANEMHEGHGLDAYSLNINGESKSNIIANEIYIKVNKMLASHEEVQAKIIYQGKLHRDYEFQTYIGLLQKKIDSLESELSEIQRKIDNDVNAVNSFFAGYFAERSNIESEIKKYTRKKTSAENAQNVVSFD